MTPERFSSPTIPGYTIKSIVGIGGFATVYLAQQQTLQRDVALKVMNPLLEAEADFCTRFLREARDTASVSNHPNIITIHDVGHVNSIYYIAMQYLPGANLKQRIENSDRSIVVDGLLHDLGSALAFVHQKGFVHRDIKPANVLFTDSGNAVLSDFGVARMDDRDTRLTLRGNVVGTATYMSPEQCRGEPAIDARSDLYSLGVVLYEVLTHHPPYESPDPMALMLKHLNEPVPRLPAKYSAYQTVLNKLMAKQANQRYESADELMEDLGSDVERNTTKGFHLARDTTGHSLNSPATRETPTSTVLAATVSVLVLVTSSLLFLYTQRTSGLPDAHLRCPELTQVQQLERDALLQLAGVHREIGRLAHPPGANALEAYVLALEIDPCNRRILDAVADIRLATENNDQTLTSVD